jgi:hypothetical protein
MGTSAERLIAQGRRRSHAGRAGGSPIHIEIEGLEETLKKMKKMEDVVRRRVMRAAGKKAAKPMIQAYKDNVDDLMEDEFIVYRDGAVYARIQPGQLRKSMDVMFFWSRARDMWITAIGPKVKGVFSDPERGGWYAHFINYGYLNNGRYRGHNIGFADRARAKAYPYTVEEFKKAFFKFASIEIAKLSRK